MSKYHLQTITCEQVLAYSQSERFSAKKAIEATVRGAVYEPRVTPFARHLIAPKPGHQLPDISFANSLLQESLQATPGLPQADRSKASLARNNFGGFLLTIPDNAKTKHALEMFLEKINEQCGKASA